MIDDFFGRASATGNSDRREFLFRAGLQDVTGDVEAEEIERPVASVVILSGQVVENGVVRNDLEGTLGRIREGWRETERWALLLLDLHFKTGRLDEDGEAKDSDRDRGVGNYFGLKLLRAITDDPELRELPIVILSAVDWDRDLDRAFTGVFEFVGKEQLDRPRIRQLIERNGLVEDDAQEIIGRSLPLLKCLREARRCAAQQGENISLLGETGTGKELIAKYLHRKSGRKGPFVTTNLVSVPETLVDDLIFGHERGAFEGAKRERAGDAESAHLGTWFLDEFGLIPPLVRGKLLRLLDVKARETRRIGAEKPKKVDLQIVLATNRFDLAEAGEFPQDLLARAKYSIPIILPALRERPGDVRLLTERLLRRAEQALSASGVRVEQREVADDAWEALEAYNFPKNVRELESLLEDAVKNYAGMRVLYADHLRIPRATRSDAEGTLVAQSPDFRTLKEPFSTPYELAIRPIDGSGALLELRQRMREIAANPIPAEEVRSILPDLEAAYGILLTAIVKSAFDRTKSQSSPNGKLNRQGALSYLYDRPFRHAASKQALKRIVKAMENAGEELQEDELLRQIRALAGDLPRNKRAPKKAKPESQADDSRVEPQ